MNRLNLKRAPLLQMAGLLCLAIALAGCSNGSSFSGGSVPVGVRSTTIRGIVVVAGNVSTTVANATIQITTTYTPSRAVATNQLRAGGSGQTGSTTPVSLTTSAVTGSDGSFALGDIPTGTTGGSVALMVASSNAALQPMQLSFTLQAGDTATLIVTLASTAAASTKEGSVVLTPQSVSVAQGASAQFSALVLSSSGQFVPFTPTLLLIGSDTDLGTVTAGGIFQATETGSGTAVAYWYGGLTSNVCAVDVTAALSGSQ